VASLTDPALDRLLDFAAEVGMVVLIHNDVDRPFARQGAPPMFLTQLKQVFARHPRNTIIWAHTGLGRVIQPVGHHIEMLESLLSDPAYDHLLFDISWDEVAKYAVSSPDAIEKTAGLLNRYPDRFLFGTDTVAPPNAKSYFAVFDMWKPVFDLLTPEAKEKILKRNYERIFDQGRKNVRAWEKTQLSKK
jgi:predicted TIM-barrel fold metal-dependent hydrolase